MGAVLDSLPEDAAETEQTGTKERPSGGLRHRRCDGNANEIVDLRQQIGVRRGRGREDVRQSQGERVEVNLAGAEGERCAADCAAGRRRIALADAVVADIDRLRTEVQGSEDRWVRCRAGLYGLGRAAQGIGATQQRRTEERHLASTDSAVPIAD